LHQDFTGVMSQRAAPDEHAALYLKLYPDERTYAIRAGLVDR
jgi:hypothetical protein